MSRYADIEPIIKKIKYSMEIGEIRGRIWFEMVLKDLEELPEVDAIPVVRCIECKYASFSFHQGELNISCENNNGLFRDVPEDGYCYCGEKVTE